MKFKAPSIGFVLMIAVYSSCALFLAWGFRQPEQDRVWTTAQKLRSGKLSEINAEDLDFFQRKISTDEALANWLQRGRPGGIISPNRLAWANKTSIVLTRTADPETCKIDLLLMAPKDIFPIKLRARGLSWQREKTILSSGQDSLKIPPLEGKAEIIIIQAESSSAKDSSYINFQVMPSCRSAGQQKPSAGN